jgi:hypothetical protein
MSIAGPETAERVPSASASAPDPHERETITMCLNCGCGELNEKHGNDANITLDDVQRAGDANGQSVEESLRNMGMAARQVVMGQGQQSNPPTGEPTQG